MMQVEFGASETFNAVLVAGAAMRGEAEDAVALARGRVMSAIDWGEVATRLGREAGRVVLVVETEGVDADTLAAALARIDAVALALDLPVVATLGPDEIDVVAATLLGPHVTLLCAPTMAQRVAALAIAGASNAQGGRLTDRVHEHEAERLQRLNEEVGRIAEVLARLTGHALNQAGAINRSSAWHGYRAEPGDASGTGAGEMGAGGMGASGIDAPLIRAAIRARRLRDGFFGGGLFEDPAWDMLLDLFAAELEVRDVSVSSLCIAAAVAPTTALRWIGKLTQAGLIERRPDPIDRRRAFMALSASGSAGMRGYVGAARRAGVGIA